MNVPLTANTILERNREEVMEILAFFWYFKFKILVLKKIGVLNNTIQTHNPTNSFHNFFTPRLFFCFAGYE